MLKQQIASFACLAMDYSRIDETRTEALDWCILASAMVAAVLIPSVGTGFFFFLTRNKFIHFSSMKLRGGLHD
jgi:hypothetical protein